MVPSQSDFSNIAQHLIMDEVIAPNTVKINSEILSLFFHNIKIYHVKSRKQMLFITGTELS